MEEVDILIAGGGIAGMSAALIFAQAGFSVICVDPGPGHQGAVGDLRSTAFLARSVELLDEAGIFADLRPLAAELRVMRLVDAGGPEFTPREVLDFEASEIGAAQFGWNVPNIEIRRVLLARLEAATNARMIHSVSVEKVTMRTNHAIAVLSDGARVKSRLVIGADGRNSRLRQDAGIGVKTTRYGQKANVFTVSHDRPHDHVSTEVHRSGGPFTLVPLAGDAMDKSAIVWMEEGVEAARLNALAPDEFEAAANLRSCGVQGALRVISPRGLWPIISQHATALTVDRLALIAEAAHVVPPIGAQGLNMSLSDIGCLRDLAVETPSELGNPSMLARYERARMRDIRLRLAGLDVLNRASLAGAQNLRDIRRLGLKTLGQTGIKKQMMRMGLG